MLFLGVQVFSVPPMLEGLDEIGVNGRLWLAPSK